jgi:hypothetical protein
MKLFSPNWTRYAAATLSMKQLLSTAIPSVPRGGCAVAISLALLLSPSAFAQGKGGGKGGGGGDGGIPGNPAIVYYANPTGLGWDESINVMDADGTNQRVLLQRNGSRGRNEMKQPAWHPDGQRIIFSYTPDNRKSGLGIYQINLDGTGLTEIIPPPASGAFTQCDVSPVPGANGKHRIVFVHGSGFGSLGTIWIVNEGNTGKTLIAADRFYSPSWAPDGRHLAFKHWDADKGLESLHLLALAEAADGTVWPVSDVVLMDSESFGGFTGPISFSKTQNTIYFSGQDAVWALHLDDEMQPLGLEPMFQTSTETGRLSASSDDTLIAITFGGSPSSIAIVNRAGSHAPIIIDGAGWPSFKR